MKLKGKVALVTGSSRGIGRAIALELAREGAKIIVNCEKTEKDAEKVVEEIKSNGDEAVFIKCYVSQEEQVQEMIKEIIKKFGKIDILVNNAGIVYDIPFFEKTTEKWRETIDVNLFGAVFCSKYAALEMKKNKTNGVVVNISSTNSTNCFSPDSIDYDISKAGINLLTKNLAVELAPDIRVNAVAPGWLTLT